jgi:NAD(P)-dependent dehydrogenase (short-subunit alcohol dehydrogenase family)
LLTKALLPLLRFSTQASILFTAADESLEGKAYWSAYSASKFGIIGLAQSLAAELEANTPIRVNCLHPGKVRTNLQMKSYPGRDPNELPLAQDIMDHYIYLLSHQVEPISGKLVVI